MTLTIFYDMNFLNDKVKTLANLNKSFFPGNVAFLSLHNLTRHSSFILLMLIIEICTICFFVIMKGLSPFIDECLDHTDPSQLIFR